jgi:hypothetical protein
MKVKHWLEFLTIYGLLTLIPAYFEDFKLTIIWASSYFVLLLIYNIIIIKKIITKSD